MSADLILWSEALRAGAEFGLSVRQSCEALQDKLDGLTLASWARQWDTLYATEQTVTGAGSSPNFDPVKALQMRFVSPLMLPPIDEEGFGYVEGECEQLDVVVLWMQNMIVFDDVSPHGPVRRRLWDIHLNRSQAIEILRAAAEATGVGSRDKGGRSPLHKYEECRAAILAAVEARPEHFCGSDGRTRQNSDRPGQGSIIAAARDWCQAQRPDLDAPSDDTLRRQVSSVLELQLRARGFRTWRF